jgi:hypothetical protein
MPSNKNPSTDVESNIETAIEPSTDPTLHRANRMLAIGILNFSFQARYEFICAVDRFLFFTGSKCAYLY